MGQKRRLRRRKPRVELAFRMMVLMWVENFRSSARVTPKDGLQGNCRKVWELMRE